MRALKKKVNCVLDADIRRFSIASAKVVVKFVEHRVINPASCV